VVDNQPHELRVDGGEERLIFQPGETLEFTPRGRAQGARPGAPRRLAEVLFTSAMQHPRRRSSWPRAAWKHSSIAK
jgi:hypothetical protein